MSDTPATYRLWPSAPPTAPPGACPELFLEGKAAAAHLLSRALPLLVLFALSEPVSLHALQLSLRSLGIPDPGEDAYLAALQELVTLGLATPPDTPRDSCAPYRLTGLGTLSRAHALAQFALVFRSFEKQPTGAHHTP